MVKGGERSGERDLINHEVRGGEGPWPQVVLGKVDPLFVSGLSGLSTT